MAALGRFDMEWRSVITLDCRTRSAATKHSVRPFVYHNAMSYNHDMRDVNDNDGRPVCLTLESGVERKKSNTPVF